MQNNHYDTIIIGSGAGGLSAAICLARAGQKVAVVEQHYVPGGWCHSFYLDGHRFSPGVHYIGALDKGQSTSRLYEGLGIGGELVFFRMNPEGYEKCWIGEHRISLPATPERLYESLSEKFPKEKKGLSKYLKLVLQVSNEIQLIPKMKGFWDNVTIAYRTRHLGKYGLFSLKRVVGWHIKDPLLRNVINIQCGDHGLPPAKASFPFHCALMSHYLDGGFYPMGGGAAIVKAMTGAIKKYGGEIRTGQSVNRIILEPSTEHKNRKWKATGVELQNGERLFATNVVSNADPEATYKMVGMENLGDKLKKKLSKTRYSVTSLMFFLVVDMDLRKAGWDSGNIWMMPDRDMDHVYHELNHSNLLNSDEFPSLFISSSSLKDPTGFDGRYHSIEVITFIDYDAFNSNHGEGNRLNGEYQSFKEKLCTKLVNSLEKILPGIREKIIKLELGMPGTNEHYIRSTKGNVYGTEKGFFQTGPFSYSAQTEIERLFMCGASIMSHGVSGASYSGVKTAAIILNCQEEDLIKPDDTQSVRIFPADDPSGWPEWLLQKTAHRKKRMKTVEV